MSKNIFFIHGFASIGRGVKSLQLKEIFDDHVYTPDLSHQPLQDVQMLSQLVEQQQIKTVIGSSLGGFYALLLALKYPVNLILINPALQSPMTLQKYIGTVQRSDGQTFEWRERQIDELTRLLKQIQPENLQKLDKSSVLVLLATHDEVLDYRIAAQLLQGANILLDEKADHRFANLQPYADLIRTWHQAV
ncbi:YqiA/YcfP family alpha/beta fold hydrolase [Acinetobacter puyangensis]|uniref:YqiA/YcfP family alpha/beta fold hydrolase n=1 Tax=Acinetobacter puyangensis TaxID=1096779 RepID=UPI003A4D87F0